MKRRMKEDPRDTCKHEDVQVYDRRLPFNFAKWVVWCHKCRSRLAFNENEHIETIKQEWSIV